MVEWWLRLTATHDHDWRRLQWELFEKEWAEKKQNKTDPQECVCIAHS